MKVIDNFLEDESLLRKMQSIILGKEFTWIYTDEVSSPWDKSGFLFCHPMFFIEKGQESKYYDLMFPLIGRLKFNNILRIKVNAYTKTHENVKHGFHRDFPHDHKVALFSLNTNNGGTEFKNFNLTTPAKKGLTLIWPTDWPWVHKGQISHTQEKDIITGWYSYI